MSAAYDRNSRDPAAYVLEEHVIRLLEHVPYDNSITEERLATLLGLKRADITALVDELQSENRPGGRLLHRTRGRDGPVRRVPWESTESRWKEHELYSPLAGALVTSVPTKMGTRGAELVEGEWFHVEVNRSLGGRSTGRWSRPDLTMVALRRYEYLPGPYVEVVPIEVKGPELDEVNVEGVYQTLALLKAGTRAYAAFHLGYEESKWREPFEIVQHEGEKVGVGIIGIRDPREPLTWIIEPKAPRREPDPSELNAFIHEQLAHGGPWLRQAIERAQAAQNGAQDDAPGFVRRQTASDARKDPTPPDFPSLWTQG